MTQDYKDILLRYLTGNLNKETKPNVPTINPSTSSTSNIGYYLDQNAGNDYEVIDILQGYQTGYSIIYGNKSNGNGFMVILDENNNPVQYIDRYTSGTLFSTFQVLNVADDGNLYGVDIKSSTPRFIMLNNVTLKTPTQDEFIVRLRQSYNIPSPLSTASNYFAITKAVGQAKYLIGATRKLNNIDKVIITELTINVGETNEWIDYYDTAGTDDFIGCSIWASWEDDTLDFKVDGFEKRDKLYYYQFFKGNNEAPNVGVLATPISIIEGYDNGYYSCNSIIVNKNLSYIGVYDGGTTGKQEKTIIRYVYNSAQGEGFSVSYANSVVNDNVPKRIQFKLVNGLCFFTLKNYEIYGGSNLLHLTTGMFSPRTSSGATVSYIAIDADGDNTNFLFYMTNFYNLYNYNIIGLDYDGYPDTGINYLVQQVYNTNNYNGISYENINSLVPNSSILYDSNDLILFARNLYNKSVYGNTTLSVVQIPNTMVNDVTIAQQDLWGQTKKVLNSSTDDFTKNIYETVYLNFYNSLLIQNRNTQNYITNMTASELLNQSVSLATDYDDMKATKYRINYIDNTSEIYETEASITNGVATYNFTIVVPYDKLIMSIDIISQDETTRYQTINGLSSLDPGKIYTITQDCYVE